TGVLARALLQIRKYSLQGNAVLVGGPRAGVADHSGGIGEEALHARLVWSLRAGSHFVVVKRAAVLGIDAVITEDVSALLAGCKRVVDESRAVFRTHARDRRSHRAQAFGVVIELRHIRCSGGVDLVVGSDSL